MAGQAVLLTIERQVVGELVDDHVRQQSGPSQATLNRTRRPLGRRHTVFAARARVFRVDMPQHPHLAGLVFELLGHVLADSRLVAAAVTNLFRRRDVMRDVLAGQMVGDLPTAVSLFPFARRRFLVRRGRG